MAPRKWRSTLSSAPLRWFILGHKATQLVTTRSAQTLNSLINLSSKERLEIRIPSEETCTRLKFRELKRPLTSKIITKQTRCLRALLSDTRFTKRILILGNCSRMALCLSAMVYRVLALNTIILTCQPSAGSLRHTSFSMSSIPPLTYTWPCCLTKKRLTLLINCLTGITNWSSGKIIIKGPSLLSRECWSPRKETPASKILTSSTSSVLLVVSRRSSWSSLVWLCSYLAAALAMRLKKLIPLLSTSSNSKNTW